MDINPVDFRGFALGGAGTPQLQNVGALGLQAFQMRLQEEEARRQQASEAARLQQNGQLALMQMMQDRNRLAQQDRQFARSQSMDERKMGLLEQQNAAELALKRQQLGQESSYKDRVLGLQEAELGVKNIDSQRDYAAKMIAQETKALSEKNKEELDTMGAFAVQARTAMNGVANPADARALQLSILDEASKNGYINKDVAKQMSQMPISGFKNALDFKILQLNKVSEYQAMNKPKSNSGSLEIVQPDGTVVRLQNLSSAAKTDTQKSLMSNEKALNQFEQIEKGYNPDYFTYANKTGAWASKENEKSAGIPGVEQGTDLLASALTGMNKEERSKFLAKRAGYLNKVDQVFNTYKKEITGAAAGEKEIEQLRASFLNGDMSPSEFKGSLEQVVSKYKTESTQYKNALGAGLEVGSTSDYYRQGLKAKGYSEEEIDTFLKSKGL